MCGLVAVISKGKNGFTTKQVDTFTQMLYADELRGKDGTGVFYNTKKNEGTVRVLKAPYGSSIFTKLKEYDEVADTLFKESNFIVGHNRSATKGKINAECTHPFRENHIVLVHNGTLISHKELHEDYEVDSRAICHSISKIGAKETIKKIDGAFALIWYNTNNNTLNFCRNLERPLHIIETSTSFVLVSELTLGLWILARNNETVVKNYPVTPKVLYSFNIDDFSNYKEEPLEFKTYEYHKSNNHYSNNSYSATWMGKYTKETSVFSFGQTVRFRTGNICGNYVEGDIIKYQACDVEDTLVDKDFESQWRIKIYGKKALLENIKNQKLMEGVINRTNIFANKSFYTVGGVRPAAQQAKILQLPLHKKGIGGCCDWCKIEVKALNHVDEWRLCNDCASIAEGDTVNYGS